MVLVTDRGRRVVCFADIGVMAIKESTCGNFSPNICWIDGCF